MPHTVTQRQLPPIFRTADHTSNQAQKRFLRATRIRLACLVAAGFFGLFVWTTGQSPVDWAGVLATICFGLTLVVEIYILWSKPDRTWYEARAAAESVKTLSWRYMMRADPFTGAPEAAEAEEVFLRQLPDILTVLSGLELDTKDEAQGPQITDAMREVRAADLAKRKELYETDRVHDQQDYYARRAQSNRNRANVWTAMMIVLETAGIIAGILKSVGAVRSDLLGFVGVGVAAISAWLQAKQHRSLAVAYTVTGLELASVRTRIQHQMTESDWSAFVCDAEEAFSREHTLWKATRGERSL